MYEKLGIDCREKLMVYSDALNVEKALKIQQQCNDLGFQKGLTALNIFVPYLIFMIVSFGIGTFLTSDFCTLSSGSTQKSKALNIVIKIATVNGLPCVKISDDLTKVNRSPLSIDLNLSYVPTPEHGRQGHRRARQASF
jgi:nicotinate phosphoribosyltransferase